MTPDDRMRLLVGLLQWKRSIAEVMRDANLQLHMTNLGYSLKYEMPSGQEFGNWILRCPNGDWIAIRNVEHLQHFFAG